MLQQELDRFHRIVGYYPNLKEPKTFNEKLMVKKIYHPDPKEAIYADKVKVRELIPQKYLHEAYSTYDPLIPINKLCIVKMNNASGRNVFTSQSLDLTKWFTTPYGKFNYEFQAIYKYITPGALIETELLPMPHQIYRFWSIDGYIPIIQVYEDSITSPSRLVNTSVSCYNTKWEKLPYTFKNLPNPDVPVPKHLDEMLNFCSNYRFPFVRIDFFDETRPVLNEFTFFPQSCKIQMPQHLDRYLGEIFDLEKIKKRSLR